MDLREQLEQIKATKLPEIAALPFLQGLREGTLTQAQRDYYVAQDHYYVTHFTQFGDRLNARLKALTYDIPADLGNEATAHLALKADEAAVRHIEPGAHNLAYLADMQKAAETDDVLAQLLSLLPCIESYHWLAEEALERGKVSPAFKGWFNYYVSDTYHAWVALYWQALADHLKMPSRRPLSDIDYRVIYATAYQHEIAFWKQAGAI